MGDAAPAVTERAVCFGPHRSLAGIVTEPPPSESVGGLPAVLLLNAGLVHRVGPNRLYVNLARRLAGSGFVVMRFDFSGIGDSLAGRTPAPFGERASGEAVEGMSLLEGSRGARRFVLAGLCSGADIALATALRDHRVVGTILLNASELTTDAPLELVAEVQARIESRYYRSHLFDPSSWGRVLRGKTGLRAARRSVVRLLSAMGRGRPSGIPNDHALSKLYQLRARGVDLLAVYSEGSVAWDLLRLSLGRGARQLTELGNVRLEFFETCDHLFTPLRAQDRLLDLVVQWATSKWPGVEPADESADP